MNKYEKMKIAEEILLELGMKVPSPVTIGANINGVIDMLEQSTDYGAIINKYKINCKEASFAVSFKRATNVSIKDYNLILKRDRLYKAMVKQGVTVDTANKILDEGGL